jgi:hypothetical protein
MTAHITIPAGPPEQKGMNFALLRDEGVTFIEKLAGDFWTNFNPADPGVAILEQLCCAITDLSYRLSFDMEDILADDPDGESCRQFFTAREILPTHPVTMDDFRKIAIDVEGVKNCWVQKEEYPSPEIYYDPEKKALVFDNAGDVDVVSVKGLRRVWIAKKTDAPSDEELIENVKERLFASRNLCEDFSDIEVMPIETVSLRGEIDLEDDRDVDEIAASIYFTLKTHISPDVKFYTMDEMLEKGVSIEDLFTGPALEKGFVDDVNLKTADKKPELHISDFIQIILGSEGVSGVRDLIVTSSRSSEAEEWAFMLDPGAMPELEDPADLYSGGHTLTFFRNGIECPVDLDKIEALVDGLFEDETDAEKGENDVSPPVGAYMEMDVHESILNLFPQNFGIGAVGISDSADPARKGMAKQLSAYLAVFDRLLSDLFAQLEGAKNLFSFEMTDGQTRFKGTLSDIPEEILAEGCEDSGMESEEDGLARRVLFLTHMAARFSEKFTDHSLLQYDFSGDATKSLEQKATDISAFLKEYPEISAKRGAAFNCADPENTWDTSNISGLEKRARLLLGIGSWDRETLSDADQEGFHMVEHVLLRPVSDDAADASETFFSVGDDADIDPFSFKITFVFPSWPERFSSDSFKQLAESILASETPAHIEFNVMWLENDAMKEFEDIHRDWLGKKADDPGSLETWDASRLLLEFLFPGSAE